MIHVYPVNDWIEHKDKGLDCICEPKINWELGIVAHLAIDGRSTQMTEEEFKQTGYK